MQRDTLPSTEHLAPSVALAAAAPTTPATDGTSTADVQHLIESTSAARLKLQPPRPDSLTTPAKVVVVGGEEVEEEDDDEGAAADEDAETSGLSDVSRSFVEGRVEDVASWPPKQKTEAAEGEERRSVSDGTDQPG